MIEWLRLARHRSFKRVLSIALHECPLSFLYLSSIHHGGWASAVVTLASGDDHANKASGKFDSL